MADEEEFTVLAEYRPYQRILEAFNGDNFRHKSRHQLIEHARYAVCVAFILAAMFAFAALSFWNLRDIEFDVKIVSFSMPIILTITQMLITHVALMRKSRAIRAAMVRLQETVVEREFSANY